MSARLALTLGALWSVIGIAGNVEADNVQAQAIPGLAPAEGPRRIDLRSSAFVASAPRTAAVMEPLAATGAEGGPALRSIARDDAALAAAAFAPRPGGGDVANLEAIQTQFSDPSTGNVVLLLWRETTTNNPPGVEVFVDGGFLGILPGLQDPDLPGTNGVNLTNLPAGLHTFAVRGAGVREEVSHLVLDATPFSNPQDVACSQGARDPSTGNCQLVISWSNGGPLPQTYWVYANGIFQGEFPGDLTEVVLNGAPPGVYDVAVRPFLQNADGRYLGPIAGSQCTLDCLDAACDDPRLLVLCQTSHGENPDSNSILATWRNGETPYPLGVAGFRDGQELGLLPGDSELAFFNLLAVGVHTFGVQGDCGDAGRSALVEQAFEVLAATPHTRPVDGAITCQFDEASAEVTVSWTLADPLDFIDVFIIRAQSEAFVGRFAGINSSVLVPGVQIGDEVVVQFFATLAGACHGSELLSCTVGEIGKSYIQGLCEGVGTVPQITSAIFGLNFLFGGGTSPPCKKACDVNGDALFDLSDMIYLLTYLFLGGPPPTTWVDSTGDPAVDPTCIRAAPEDDCETALDACN